MHLFNIITDEIYNEVMVNGLNKVWKEDSEAQKTYLSYILKNARSSSEDLLNGTDAIFVPNLDYLVTYFGDIIKSEEFDIYGKDGYTKYLHCVLIPIYDSLGKIVATTAYNPEQTIINKSINQLKMKTDKTEQDIKDLEELMNKKDLKYILPSAKRISGANYMYFPKGVYEKSINDGYIVVVDGMFDAISLNHYGINAGALMGSKVTPVKLFTLSFIDKVFVANDNDLAGLQVLNNIKNSLDNVIPIKNRKTSDIDEYISKFGVENIKNQISSCLKDDYKKIVILK